MEIWRKHIAEELDAYMDLIFERVALQAFLPHAEGVGIRVITWSLGDLFPSEPDRAPSWILESHNLQ